MIINREVHQDGDKVSILAKVCGDDRVGCNNAVLNVTLPTGVRLVGPVLNSSSVEVVVTHGVYNSSDSKWIIGNLPSETCYETPFEIIVDDITQANLSGEFEIPFLLTSDCTVDDPIDNLFQLVIKVKANCSVEDLTIG